jgi:hypothetical protein
VSTVIATWLCKAIERKQESNLPEEDTTVLSAVVCTLFLKGLRPAEWTLALHESNMGTHNARILSSKSLPGTVGALSFVLNVPR